MKTLIKKLGLGKIVLAGVIVPAPQRAYDEVRRARELTELQNREAARVGQYSKEKFSFPERLIDYEEAKELTELQNAEANKNYP